MRPQRSGDAAVSADPLVVGPVSAEPRSRSINMVQWVGSASGGTFNLTRQEEADEMIIAMKTFLKPE